MPPVTAAQEARPARPGVVDRQRQDGEQRTRHPDVIATRSIANVSLTASVGDDVAQPLADRFTDGWVLLDLEGALGSDDDRRDQRRDHTGGADGVGRGNNPTASINSPPSAGPTMPVT